MELKEYLNQIQISQLEFAKKLGITPATLSRIVLKKGTPRLSLASAIVVLSKGYVSYEDLLSKDDQKKIALLRKQDLESFQTDQRELELLRQKHEGVLKLLNKIREKANGDA